MGDRTITHNEIPHTMFWGYWHQMVVLRAALDPRHLSLCLPSLQTLWIVYTGPQAHSVLPKAAGQKETVKQPDINCSRLLSVAMISITSKRNSGEGRVYLAYTSRSQSVTGGRHVMDSSRNLVQKPCKKSACQLTHLLAQAHRLSHSTQDSPAWGCSHPQRSGISHVNY